MYRNIFKLQVSDALDMDESLSSEKPDQALLIDIIYEYTNDDDEVDLKGLKARLFMLLGMIDAAIIVCDKNIQNEYHS